ncbi:MAG TPA: nicotinate-nucleotide--dimethylbenzimidazole phosphoribosyltransferase, partial [Stellaceae bacterium]|nr:nicotinate-nucleotide--dimethylbenzimidazole phosphoribosyltransferase [Stellaceae bacterium]
MPSFAIAPVDRSLAAALQAKIDGKTKPPGALGRLERLAMQIGLIQGTLSPRLTAPHVLLFAGDHGAVAEGISAYPQDVTWQMVLNFLNGGAAINVFARQNGLAVKIVDAGVAHEFDPHPALVPGKIAPGTRNYLREPAMTEEQRDRALAAGAALVDECAAAGTNVIACGEMGIGNTASASLLVNRVLGLELTDCVGRGTGLDDRGLERKLAVLQRASSRRPEPLAPLEVLAEFGGFEIAMMTGAFLGAAQARMVVLVDGFIATAAFAVAAALHPDVRDYAVFAHVSAE